MLAAACDGVVLVVRSRQTGRQALSRARTRLATARARILGAVLNDWRRPGPRSRDLYDGYGYAYGYGPQTGNLATKGNGNGHPKPASAPQANAERS